MNTKRTLHLLIAALLWAAPAMADDVPPKMSPEAKMLGELEETKGWFGADPQYEKHEYDGNEQLEIYTKKYLNKTARPLIEWGMRLYDRGEYTPRPTWLGRQNPINFHFLTYGDLRFAGAVYDRGVSGASGTQQSVAAVRLNLDMDLALTSTERIHAFVRPLDKNGSFTRYQFRGAVDEEFIDEFDFDLDTLFFEGDLGAIREGFTGRRQGPDHPIAFGRVPLLTQNGVWVEDAFDGLAFGFTARNSPKYDISNMDLTFFAAFDKITTAAAPGDDAKAFGFAGFMDARKGYIEYGYGYVAADDEDLSYHNVTASFTRRYFGHLANSVRVIGNFGQKGIAGNKTADGVLLLVENSFFRRNPSTLVPYVNLFAGFDSPQSLARNGDAGGVLRNTGINFESDGITAYPTLDASAREAYGGAAGVEYLFALDRQIVFEGAVVQRTGGGSVGDEYALGVRYQHPITNAWIVRADAMHGWRQGQKDVYGVRLELRRKF